jgi:phage terminase small subunit
MRKIPTGAKGWCKEARRMWKELNEKYDFSPTEIETLRVACHALTRLRGAETQLDELGLVFTTAAGMVKKNPLCEVVKNERVGFLNSLRQLGISDEQDKREVGRPAGDPRQISQVRKWQR